MIATKIHFITGFPYSPKTDILTLPVELNGLDYPSLARINAGIATEGLWRDLNHHVPAYRNMARLTLANWTCVINRCVYPLDGKGLQRDFTGQYRNIPAAWIIAHKIMITLEPKLALRMTDCSHILRGEVSLSHVLNVAKAHGKWYQTPEQSKHFHRVAFRSYQILAHGKHLLASPHISNSMSTRLMDLIGVRKQRKIGLESRKP
jgi:hypothetical protein